VPIATYSQSGAPTSGTSEVQLLTIGGTPTGGTFVLAYRGQTTTNIAWSATNSTLLANITAALEALSTIGAGNVVLAVGTLTAGIGTITITFQGTLARMSVLPITVSVIALTGTAPTVAITVTTEGIDASQSGAAKGSLLVDIVTAQIYRNAGTTAAPIWQLITASPQTVEVKTADYTIVAPDDNEKLFTNEGAGGTVTFALPAATVGQRYHFVVKAAQELRIDPNGSQTIALDTGVQQAAGKYITANAIGERITVECVKAGEWDTSNPVGTWGVEP